MRDLVRKAVIAATALITITATTVAVPTSAEARWGGGFHGGGFRGGGWHGGGHWRGGGWGLGAAGLAIGTGIALAATAPYAYGGYYDDDYYAYPRYTYGYGYPYGYRRAYYGYRGYYPTYRRAYVYGGYPSYRRAYYGALDPLILPHLDHRSVQIGPVPALEPPGSRLNSAATGQLLPHATGAIYIGPRQPAAWLFE